MNTSSPFSAKELDQLLAQECISSDHPWSTRDESQIDSYLKTVSEEVSLATNTLSRIEWGHYGSGYASFVDAWFYRSTPAFDVPSPLRQGEEHVGLVVLLSRLSPYFVFMEGEKRWHAKGGSSYLPAFEGVDSLSSPGVLDLVAPVQKVLESRGLRRLSKKELSSPLHPDIQVPTILGDPPYVEFDALFHWED
jgi:hypothetical protein